MLENLTKKFDTLSDGLYAIIMTILVLSIKVPDKMSQLPQLGRIFFGFSSVLSSLPINGTVGLGPWF